MRNKEINQSDLVDVTGLEGKWLLEVKGRIVASSERVDEILRCAEKYPPEDILVTKVLYPDASYY